MLLLRRNMWADGLVELVQTLGQRARGVAPDVSGLVVSGVKLGAGGLDLWSYRSSASSNGPVDTGFKNAAGD